jgi:hypothetical protein
MSRAIQLIQAQRACVMQPRVRRILGIKSPHTFISPNSNGVPLVSTDHESRLLISTERDGYSASPDRRWQAFKHAQPTPESAGGPAHSRTLPRAFTPAFL